MLKKNIYHLRDITEYVLRGPSALLLLIRVVNISEVLLYIGHVNDYTGTVSRRYFINDYGIFSFS